MKIKDLKIIKEALIDLGDFMESNTDSDESGIGDEMALKYNKAIKIIEDEEIKLYIRNKKASINRKSKNYE